MSSQTFPLRVAPRPRAFLQVAGPDAAAFLQRLVSNDVEALESGSSCEALLLTPKARVIAPLRILRRAADDFLVLTEPELGDRVRRELLRFRLASRVQVERESHESLLVVGDEPPPGALPNEDYGLAAYELLDAAPPAGAVRADDDELELLRIEARSPRWGRELDDRVMPAEAGIVERTISFTKGCYPGQEPVARLHYRGHANRGLRVLELEGSEPPPYDAEVRLGEKVVGRVTSAVPVDGGVRALGYVRVDLPDETELTVEGRRARLH
jgi:tRNA-modifying protein YgfZ